MPVLVAMTPRESPKFEEPSIFDLVCGVGDGTADVPVVGSSDGAGMALPILIN